MTYYTDYLEEISTRKKQGLHAKPIDNLSLMEEIIQQIKDDNNVYRKESLHYFIYNTLPGTTGSASAKAGFLKDIALNKNELKKNYHSLCSGISSLACLTKRCLCKIQNSSVRLFVHPSSVRPFVRSLVRSFVRSLVRSFLRWFVRLFWFCRPYR